MIVSCRDRWCSVGCAWGGAQAMTGHSGQSTARVCCTIVESLCYGTQEVSPLGANQCMVCDTLLSVNTGAASSVTLRKCHQRCWIVCLSTCMVCRHGDTHAG
jgi:hypothetical protein